MSGPALSPVHFLAVSKAKYLKDVEGERGKDWVVVMGNEAGDLDSLASAIAYAWYRSAIKQDAAIPLVQTPRADLSLRTENLYALELAGLNASTQDLLCIDDVPASSPFPSVKFALVDHNHLQSRFTEGNPEARVVAVLDHHEDEGHHTDADPRIIVVPTGSAASLVTRLLSEQCPDAVPKGLLTLLLCAIVVDTNGLKPGGKAEKIDREAAAFLAPRSLLFSPDSLAISDLHEDPRLQELLATLQSKKGDVSHLGTRDLLRRDYKEYSFVPSRLLNKTVLVGLSSVPVGLHPWISTDKSFWSSTEQWMADRNLSVLGILTSFRDEKKLNKHGKPKHRREQLFVVREDVGDLAERLFKGLKSSEELDLKKRSLAEDYNAEVPSSFAKRYKAKVWEQGNNDATRKVTAPLVKRIIEG
ncbi:uncharacterized protein PHACADRAFT_254655 [Phanerochaete carnosa HHB-10118-sp]|uniref:DHHA2 domain-containing protein n=1 Tax=Phanerochaete carnosa (strain HHB-10118-sp) TaxID=650164 RepID=K5WDI9_PHACS|nr:uncharacterized protein PHACADRAFT_254655 [Phanerochaete carnosa HHB-10118-sp]EKM57099.1 hypothetical protein PHACADRAFT_254655 [Phanerochaete carnosa HHB-10118-sp]